jgi:hypothetical protein
MYISPEGPGTKQGEREGVNMYDKFTLRGQVGDIKLHLQTDGSEILYQMRGPGDWWEGSITPDYARALAEALVKMADELDS